MHFTKEREVTSLEDKAKAAFPEKCHRAIDALAEPKAQP